MLSLNNAKFLVEKEIIRPKVTLISLVNFKQDKEFVILESFIDKDAVSFHVKEVDGLKMFKVTHKVITKIDGMNVDKIIDAYCVEDELNTIEVNDETDVVNDVVGKSNAIINDILLEEDMKLILHNDKTPEMNDKILTVGRKNGVLKLIQPRGRPKKVKETE